LISIAGGDISVEEALGTNAPLVNAIFAYDDSTGTWERYVPGAPDGVNTITTLEAGHVYWVYAKSPFTLVVPR
ncbi:MAG: hypothetical protein KC495_09970, partial [Dehalococcoidia bacterium]|nr:hypothetical protein [Dehalococcoidia bacterium]